jgi:hypothetical protein
MNMQPIYDKEFEEFLSAFSSFLVTGFLLMLAWVLTPWFLHLTCKWNFLPTPNGVCKAPIEKSVAQVDFKDWECTDADRGGQCYQWSKR